jgi:hypothetical protein
VKLTGLLSLLAIAVSLVAVSACATTSGVIVNPAVHKATYTSVYVVVHGDRSADMDANIQKELLRHGLGVSVGTEGNASATSAQLIVRYADDWKWDLSMYLHSFDLMVFDSKTNTLLVTGSWKDSVAHGYYGADGVVGRVVDDTLGKIATQ